MSLESNKTLGGIGAILVAIGYIASFTGYGAVLSLVGIILVLVAMKGLADYYNEPTIFNDTLYGFIFGIIGIIALVAIFVSAFAGLSMTAMMDPQQILASFFAWIILGVILLVIFIIL